VGSAEIACSQLLQTASVSIYQLPEGSLLASSNTGEQLPVIETLRQSCCFRATRLAHAALSPMAANDADCSAGAIVNPDGAHAIGTSRRRSIA